MSVLLLVWALVGGTASAGTYLPLSGSAELSRQRAVLLLEGTTTTLLVQSSFVGTATELAWIIPVGGIGAAQEVGFAPADAFSHLHEQSAPRLVRVVEKRKDLGCTTKGVTFVTQGQIEPWSGPAASDIAHSALDGQVSSQIVAWLQGDTLTDVCTDRATTCATDEDCGGITTCDIDGGCYAGSGNPSGCCMNQIVSCDDDDDCGGDIDCFERMCVALTPTCADDTDCGGREACGPLGFCRYLTPACTRDEDCGGVSDQGPEECVANTCGDGTPCSNDTHCGGVAECAGGTCVDGGGDCDVDEDCDNGVTECKSHCSNLQVPCEGDNDCDYECRLGHCQQRAGGLCQARDCPVGDTCDFTCPDGSSCTSNEQCVIRTEVDCDAPSDCAAAEECQTFSIAGSDVSLCVDLAPFCSSGAECNVACVEEPPGSGDKLCAGSSIPCTDTDNDGLDPACSAVVECQQEVCLNLTATCTSEVECTTTCDAEKCGGVGIPCDGDLDCRGLHDCRSRPKIGDSYPLSDDQLAWLSQHVDDGANFVVSELSGVSAATGTDALAPLSIRIGGDVPSFPMRSLATALDLELYVIAAERYRPANYPSNDMVIDEVFEGSDFDSWYQEQVERNLANAEGPKFLVEHADVIERSLVEKVLGRAPNTGAIGSQPWFLTKLRARIAAGDAGEDLQLTSTGDTQPFVIRAIGGSPATQASLPVGGLGILVAAALVWRRARRRR